VSFGWTDSLWVVCEQMMKRFGDNFAMNRYVLSKSSYLYPDTRTKTASSLLVSCIVSSPTLSTA
jgi:hypothetical protein